MIITISSAGIVSVSYDAGTPLPNESHIVLSPTAGKWTIAANGTTGAMTVTDGATGGEETYLLVSPNGISWRVTVSDTGVITVTSIDSTLALSPVGVAQIISDSNPAVGILHPATGFLLYTYAAGTLVPKATYMDNLALLGPQPNPIVLDNDGFPTAPMFLVSGEYYRFILKSADSSILIYDIDNISIGSPVNQVSAAEFTSPARSVTFSGTDNFTIKGDQRSTLRVGRRLKFNRSVGAAIYGTIASNSYNNVDTTTVFMYMDSTVLDTNLLTIQYALVSPSGAGTPARKTVGNTTYLAGNLTIAAKDGMNLLPVGMVDIRLSAPTGWLQCNGAAVSRTTYSELFAAIGTTFGVGDGSTTFNLPNLTPPTLLMYIIYAKV